jgi:glycosyltransferase involved in cell wall biosynthesis
VARALESGVPPRRAYSIAREFATVCKIFTSSLGLKYFLFGVRVRFRTWFRHYDFCQIMDVMSLSAAPGLARRAIPLILDINEIPELFERQGSHFVAAAPRVKEFLNRAIERDMRPIDSIMTTSGAMSDFVAERFGRQAIAVRNARLPVNRDARSSIRLDAGAGAGDTVIVYPCTAAPHLGVETSIEVLGQLPQSYRLVFVGRFLSPAYEQQIARLTRLRGLTERVHCQGPLSNDAYLSYIAGADIGLVPLSFHYRNQRLVLPWRIVDLAAAAVPIVATANEEVLRLKRDYDLGEIAETTDADGIARALLCLARATPARIAAIRGDLALMSDRFSPATRRAQYAALLEGTGRKRTGRALFICNIALRANQRIIAFVDQACELGYEVDLLCVRPPEHQFLKYPDKVRPVTVSDRLIPSGRLARRWPTLRRLDRIVPGAKAILWIGNWFAGLWFGGKQIRRAIAFAKAIRRSQPTDETWDVVLAADVFALAAGLGLAKPASFLIFDATEIPEFRHRTSRFIRGIPALLRLPFRIWENAYVARAKLILTPSHALAFYLERRYKAKSRAEICPVANASPRTRLQILTKAAGPSLRVRLGLPDSDIVMVSPCGISAETGALVAIRTLRFLPENHVLVFIGRFSSAAAEAEVRAVLKIERKEHRCFFLGELEYELYLRCLADCDIGLILFDMRIANLRLAAPNRLFDLIAMEVPIVSSRLREIERMEARFSIGTIVKEIRPALVAKAVLDLRRRVCGADGRLPSDAAREQLHRMAEMFSWSRERASLIDALTANLGTLQGKRVAMLTLRSASSNRRFVQIGKALEDAGVGLRAFDTSIGAVSTWDGRPEWLTTIPLS